jgi:glycosyltransferase involved in cell wall biosynthesis
MSRSSSIIAHSEEQYSLVHNTSYRKTMEYTAINQSLPFVSIITPVYNGSKYLEQLIQSVLLQDYPRIEHIVIDDGSTDNGATVEILKRYSHLRWRTRPNQGQYRTMNEGFQTAAGDLVTFICADDILDGPKAISTIVQGFLDNPQCDAVYGESREMDAEGLPIYFEGPRSGPIWMLRYYGRSLTHASMLVRRKFLFSKGIYFDESFQYSADYDWLNRLIQAGCRFRRIRKPMLVYRRHPGQLSNEPLSSRRIAQYNELFKKYPRNPLVKFCVDTWIIMVRVKNLYQKAGLYLLLQKGKDWFKRYFSRKSLERIDSYSP